MKILSNLLLCALILCAVSSCQKDEDNLPITIEGKWEIKAASCQDGIQTITENNSTSGGAFIFEGESFSSEIDFMSDATFKGSGGYTKVLSTLVGGNMMTESIQANEFENEGDWKKLETNLELLHENVETFEIVELTSETLELKFDLNETLEDGNRTINNVGTVFYSLKRK